MRLQEYGVGIFHALPTRSALKKALKRSYVRVNGKVASTATMITGGERISLLIPEETYPNHKLDFPLKVIFEDEHLAIVHKPAGIPVSGNKFKTIAHALPQNLRPSALPDATTPQPVHRLDYPTTGILLIGKTQSSIRKLNEMFARKKIFKTYCAVTIGKMAAYGTINTPVNDQQSQSDYKVIASVPSKRFGTLNLVELHPRTGRTHQLRKHMLHIDHPILGDKIYFHKDLVLKGKGLYLHAYALTFVHPFTKESISVKDDLPRKFHKIFSPSPLDRP